MELGGEGAGKDANAEKPKKKIIRNPQPKLDADRILGPRGVPILEEVFKDFKPKGGMRVERKRLFSRLLPKSFLNVR